MDINTYDFGARNYDPQIPIGTYKAGSIALPISMDYSGNGVKVDQAATWTGINWTKP